MVQTFDPAKVMLADTVGKEVTDNLITAEFVKELANVSKVIQLGQRIDMGNQYIKKVKALDGELSDAYFVGEGEKIGIAPGEGGGGIAFHGEQIQEIEHLLQFMVFIGSVQVPEKIRIAAPGADGLYEGHAEVLG